MLFRIFALKQNLRKPLLIRALKNSWFSMRVFALYFLGGKGWGFGQGYWGANFLGIITIIIVIISQQR